MTIRSRVKRTALGLAGVVAVGVPVVGGVAPAHAADAETTLSAIRHCESGGDYQAQNETSTASGAYQFLDSTWQAVAGDSGYASAADAPAEVQDAAALELLQQQGTAPWAASQGCWGSEVEALAPSEVTGDLSTDTTSTADTTSVDATSTDSTTDTTTGSTTEDTTDAVEREASTDVVEQEPDDDLPRGNGHGIETAPGQGSHPGIGDEVRHGERAHSGAGASSLAHAAKAGR